VKTGCNLAESSKEGYGSKRVVLPIMMMIRSRRKKWERHVAKMGRDVEMHPTF
jgi:hypothetical protein